MIMSPSSIMELPSGINLFLENIIRADLEGKISRPLDLRCVESLLAEDSIFLRDSLRLFDLEKMAMSSTN